jgi:hypothetical protein
MKEYGRVEVQLHALFTSALQHEYRGSELIACASNSVVTSSDLSLGTKYQTVLIVISSSCDVLGQFIRTGHGWFIPHLPQLITHSYHVRYAVQFTSFKKKSLNKLRREKPWNALLPWRWKQEFFSLRWDILVVCYKYHKNEAEQQSEHN